MNYGLKSIETRKKKNIISVRPNVDFKTRGDLSIYYTPGVAAVSKKIAENPKSVFDLTIKRNSVAIVSDGSAVLGLGNIGPGAALPVMEGKALLFSHFAGIDAWPICLATQDTDDIVKTVENIAPVFGGINLEDIAAPRCFEIERRLQNLGIPVMHDDQHGTAAVVLAGLINALQVVGKKIEDVKIVISGAGAAGTAVAKLILGYSLGRTRIIMIDSVGAICFDRSDLSIPKKELLEMTQNTSCGDLESITKEADVFIGVSAPRILSAEMVKRMSPRAIVFALANPIPEIDPAAARVAGAEVVATGRSDYPNQINNVLAFPGIWRGALDVGATAITQGMILAAAEAIAKTVVQPTAEKIVPPVLDRQTAAAVAAAVARVAKSEGVVR